MRATALASKQVKGGAERLTRYRRRIGCAKNSASRRPTSVEATGSATGRARGGPVTEGPSSRPGRRASSPERLPSGNLRFVDPQSQIAASLEAGFVLRPILER
jgi:hypothetical protein